VASHGARLLVPVQEAGRSRNLSSRPKRIGAERESDVVGVSIATPGTVGIRRGTFEAPSQGQRFRWRTVSILPGHRRVLMGPGLIPRAVVGAGLPGGEGAPALRCPGPCRKRSRPLVVGTWRGDGNLMRVRRDDRQAAEGRPHSTPVRRARQTGGVCPTPPRPGSSKSNRLAGWVTPVD